VRIVKELARKPGVRERRSAEEREKQLETEREIKAFGFNTEDTEEEAQSSRRRRELKDVTPTTPRQQCKNMKGKRLRDEQQGKLLKTKVQELRERLAREA
jgi:hypothetical protein